MSPARTPIVPTDPTDRSEETLLCEAAAEWRRRFNAGDFYGAHEVAEDTWHAYRGPLRDFLKGLVQLAVSLHHHYACNQHGASVKWASSRGYLQRYEPECLGIDITRLVAEVSKLYEADPPGQPREETIRPYLP